MQNCDVDSIVLHIDKDQVNGVKCFMCCRNTIAK